MLFDKHNISIIRVLAHANDPKVQKALLEGYHVAFIGGGAYRIIDEDESHVLVDTDNPICSN